MFSPAFIRLCWLAVMAPALTKAVREADGFNFMLMSQKNGVLLPSKLPFTSDRAAERHAETHHATNGCSDLGVVSNGEFWQSCNGNTLPKDTNNHVSDKSTPGSESPKPPHNVNGHCYLPSVVADTSTTPLQNCDLDVLQKSSSSPPLSPPGSPKSCSGESTSTVTAHNPPVVTFTELEEVRASHEKSKARIKELLTRLRKLQLLQVDKHVVEQLKLLFAYYQKALSVPCQRQQKTHILQRPKDPIDLKAEFLQSEDVRNLSTAALVSLVRKLESSSNIPSKSSEVEGQLSQDDMRPKLHHSECTQIKQTCGMLLTQMRHLECAIDSDATDSSSGGESCDEYEGYDIKKTNSIPFRKRAMWSYVYERAPIAKQWTWLQSQVQDLEYRVRQITDLLTQARVAKGMASFEEMLCLEAQSSSSLQDPSATIRKTLRTVNGFVDHNSHSANCDFSSSSVQNVPPSSEPCLDVANKATAHGPSSSDDCLSVSRSRPFRPEVFRKRKLLYTAGLHYVSRKAARLSTVKCNCSSRPDIMPCIICCGRYNNTQSIDPHMPLPERVALLQPTFHSVLSIQKDITVSTYFEQYLKTDEQYYKVSDPGPTPMKISPQISLKPARVILDQARHHSRKLKKHAAQTLLSSAKNRSKKHSSSSLQNRGLMISRWKNIKDKNSLKRKKKHFRWSAASSYDGSRQTSPLHSASVIDDSVFLSSFSGKDSFDMRRRRDGHEFDIDNIVIPYNIKTASSFQKLHYKEILTPKWRFMEENMENGPVSIGNVEVAEDISDDLVAKRHERLEIAERKILRGGQSATSMNSARRARKSFRHDSRADSSGANTPDHLSWYHQDIMFQDSNSFISGGPSSPVLSPPATPGSINTVSDDSQPSCSNATPTDRKRSVSFTKRDKSLEEAPLPTDFIKEYPPFETRIFPLTNEVWDEIEKEAAIIETLLRQEELEQQEEDDNHNNNKDQEQVDEEEMSHKEPSSPDSPDTSSSTSSALEDDENTADPEWTVVRKHNDTERTLVLKLAKR